MPYVRSKELVANLLPAVLATPEVANEIERKAIRRDVLVEETLDHVGDIWESVSARVEAYDLTERTIMSLKQGTKIPEIPQYLRRIRTLAWTLIGLPLIGGSTAVEFGFAKGWAVTGQYLTGVLSPRTWAFAAVNLLVIGGALLAWHRRRDSFFKKLIQSATEKLNAQLKPLEEQLETEKKLADESLEHSVTSEVREIISLKKVSWFGTYLPDTNPEGLSQVQNPEFEITTAAGDRLKRIIKSVSGASVGISGPRGAGKTTLLWSNYQIGNTKPNVLSVFTSAPVEYEAREFVLHLFASVCARVIEKAVGRREQEETRRYSYETGEPYSSESLYRSQRTFRLITVVGTVLLYAGLILAYFKTQAIQSAAAAQTAKRGVPFTATFLGALDISPSVLLEWGLFLTVIPYFTRPYINSLLIRMRGKPSTSSAYPGDRAYEKSLEMKGPLVLSAYYQLSDIRFQQSFTSGWSGSLNLPVALEGAMKSDRSWSERQRTLPDIVDDYRRFLDRVVGSKDTPYQQVLICIDELDKLESDEAAQRFLNGIKSIFNQASCYYLVSVSENAMSSFERRGLPIRDAFDSSFDEVIQVDYQSLVSSKRLLSRRVLNLPHPFLCFCHVLAGGLPRDLIRVCRALFDAKNVGIANTLADICGNVIFTDIRAKLHAMAVVVRQRPDLPRNFVNHLEACSPKSGADLWRLISILEGDQSVAAPTNEGAPKTALPTEALLFAYFSVTVLEIFEQMDEASWRKGEDDGLFEDLSAVRRSLLQNPKLVVNEIARIRLSFGLPPVQRGASAAQAAQV